MKYIRRGLLALCVLTFAVGLAGCAEPGDMSSEGSMSSSQLNR